MNPIILQASDLPSDWRLRFTHLALVPFLSKLVKAQKS